jgi:hypothetical protein
MAFVAITYLTLHSEARATALIYQTSESISQADQKHLCLMSAGNAVHLQLVFGCWFGRRDVGDQQVILKGGWQTATGNMLFTTIESKFLFRYNDTSGGYRVIDLRFPDWFLLILVLAGSFVSALVARAYRVRPGMCKRCGYDLRASPIRCPECGEPNTEAKESETEDDVKKGTSLSSQTPP